ncbi:uncharacterized protein LOC135394364 [Ornithodoros turicata]|uniref:uncharacterized protein LOC135394364 n=1 Tax=Ornithodoros turicata TaxID=34597 RepID=UPI0031390D23
MSSVGAVTTARPSRESSEYKLILPSSMPSGTVSLNTLFLHADPSGRPYKVEDFGTALEGIVKKEDVSAFGGFQFNHLWALTFHNGAAKDKLLLLKEITVKGRRCVILDPNKKEVTMKIHWLPQHVPDEAVVNAFAKYGKVANIVRQRWKTSFFEGLETTTRHMNLTLKGGVTTDSLPHMLQVSGCHVLIDVPGRPPLCLRCKGVGHIRKQCHTPWCKTCRRFGHEADECVTTYASRLRKCEGQKEDLVIDIDEANGCGGINERQDETAGDPEVPENSRVREHQKGESPALQREWKDLGCANASDKEAEQTKIKCDKSDMAEAFKEKRDKEEVEGTSVKKYKTAPRQRDAPNIAEVGRSQLEDVGFPEL